MRTVDVTWHGEIPIGQSEIEMCDRLIIPLLRQDKRFMLLQRYRTL